MGKTLKHILAAVGSPFYFLISRGILGLIAIFYSFRKLNKNVKKKRQKKDKGQDCLQKD